MKESIHHLRIILVLNSSLKERLENDSLFDEIELIFPRAINHQIMA